MTRSSPKPLVSLSLAVLCAVAAGCRDRAENGPGTPDTPVVVLLGPRHGGSLSPAQLATLAADLSQRSALKVDVQVASSPASAIQKFGTHRADVGILSLFAYMLAHDQYGVQAALRVVRAGGSREYRAEVVTLQGGPSALKQLEDRKVAFVDPYSVSGFLLPAAMLGNTPVQAVFTGSVAASLAQLHASTVDAAAVYEGAAAGDAALRVVATSAAVPNEPVFFRQRLPQATVQAVSDALVGALAANQTRAILTAVAGMDGLEPVTDAAYAQAYGVLDRAGKRVEDLVPGGRDVVWSNRSPVWGE